MSDVSESAISYCHCHYNLLFLIAAAISKIVIRSFSVEVAPKHPKHGPANGHCFPLESMW